MAHDPIKRLTIAVHHISADQFARLRDGDRFFFTHNNEAGSLSEAGRQYILDRTFSDIICDNTNMLQIQPDAFRIVSPDNPLSDCIASQDTDLIEIIQGNNFRGRGISYLTKINKIYFWFLHIYIFSTKWYSTWIRSMHR